MEKIQWIKDGTVPKAGERVAIKLPDGRVCSGKVTQELGLELEYVDNLSLMATFVHPEPINWYPLTNEIQVHKRKDDVYYDEEDVLKILDKFAEYVDADKVESRSIYRQIVRQWYSQVIRRLK